MAPSARRSPAPRSNSGARVARAEQKALRALVEGTAADVGHEFFRSLVRGLASAMDVRYAFVSEFCEGSSTRVRMLAFWGGEGFLDNLEYDLAGHPCERVVSHGFLNVRDDVQREFPHDDGLRQIGARAYVGVPLVNPHGDSLGHLAVIHTEPLADEARGLDVFRIFAARAGAELERLRVAQALEAARDGLERTVQERTRELRRREEELRSLLGINRAIARHLDRPSLFSAVMDELRRIVPVDRLGVLVPVPETDEMEIYALNRADGEPRLTVGNRFPRAQTVGGWVLESGSPFVSGRRDEFAKRFPATAAGMAREDMQSVCALPMTTDGPGAGALFFFARQTDAFPPDRLPILQEIAKAAVIAVENCFAYEEIARLHDRLARENEYLQEEIRTEHNFEEIVGKSPALLRVLRQVEQVAPTDATVLIAGETGTGKELFARALHARSTRRDRPLVKVNCAAISAGLVESELFGHVKGAFTGAVEDREGRFGLADNGTLFLDEVGELPLETQVKLLRVLQEREFEPVGSSRSRKVDVRVIAATNRDLPAEVAAGRFRSDLFYRLNVFPIGVPPLRERREDIAPLALRFLQRSAAQFARPVRRLTPGALDRLAAYDWPGNVRELQNIVERAVLLCDGPVVEITPELVPGPAARPGAGAAAAAPGGAPLPPPAPATPPPVTLEEMQRRHILDALERTGGVIEGAGGAARLLDLHPNTLRSRMKKLGIRAPRRARVD